ncbi:MAG: MoaD/ThiS family protein [Micrococcales bacterium]|nr:MoaD/ThiS family protein [Micrococcales bacterium]
MSEAVIVTVRYWAGARAVAGVDADQHAGATVGDVLESVVSSHPDLRRIATVATFLLDGRHAERDTPVVEGVTLEVLPPFAGG